MKNPEYKIELFKSREKDRSKLDADHGRVRRLLDGDGSVLWEINSGAEENPIPRSDIMFIANIMLASGEQIARRIAAAPTIRDIPTDPRKKNAQRRAELGELVKTDWWMQNKMHLTGRKIARDLLAYRECPIVISPDRKRGIPKYTERDPLTAYPSEAYDWRPEPHDCIFRYRRRLGDLRAVYPSAHGLSGPDGTMVDVLEYLDPDEHSLMAFQNIRNGMMATKLEFAQLIETPNPSGETMVVVPRRIAFGEAQGAFNQLVGLMAAQARLTILMMMAAERQVFPDTFIHGRIISPEIAQGPDAVTLLDEKAQVTRLSYNSGFQFLQEIDRIERAVRVGGGFPAQFGGETPSTLATGRGNQTLIGATVDENIRENQEILGEGYRAMMERGVAMMKSGMLGSTKTSRKVIVTEDDGQDNIVTYTPDQLTQGTTRVEYGLLSAADAAQATVMVGQLVGTGLLSEEGGREKHPFIDKPALEGQRHTREQLEKMMLQSVAAKIESGELDPLAIARMEELITAGSSISEALKEVLAQAAPTELGVPGPMAGPAAVAPGKPPVSEIMSRLLGNGQAQSMIQQAAPIGA